MMQTEGRAGPSPPPLVLASASPRRADLLRLLGLPFSVHPARLPEKRAPGEAPAAYVERLAREKGGEAALWFPDALVVAGDTTVALGETILEKPAGPEEAVGMLMRLSGRDHDVWTGLAVAGPGGRLVSAVRRTQVWFRPFDEAVARDYVATGEPLDKAGAYGIQGVGAALVERIEGDYFNVVGLPLTTLLDLFALLGFDYDFRGLVPVGR